MSNPDTLVGTVLYAIHRYEDNELVLEVTPKDYWSEHQCMADWTPQEVLTELQEFGFIANESMEGVVEISDPGYEEASEATEMALVLFLESSDLFEMDLDFLNFIQECNEN